MWIPFAWRSFAVLPSFPLHFANLNATFWPTETQNSTAQTGLESWGQEQSCLVWGEEPTAHPPFVSSAGNELKSRHDEFIHPKRLGEREKRESRPYKHKRLEKLPDLLEASVSAPFQGRGKQRGEVFARQGSSTICKDFRHQKLQQRQQFGEVVLKGRSRQKQPI